MSTMKADLLQNRLGTSHPAVTKADFVKAWAGFNAGSGGAIWRFLDSRRRDGPHAHRFYIALHQLVSNPP